MAGIPGMGEKIVWPSPPLAAELGHYAWSCQWWGAVAAQVWHNETHAHPLLELMFVSEGEGEMEIRGSTYPLERGSVAVAFPYEPHRVSSRPDRAMGVCFVAFLPILRQAPVDSAGRSADALLESFLASPDRVKTDLDSGLVGVLFHAIHHELEARPPGWSASARALSGALILHVARLFCAQPGSYLEQEPSVDPLQLAVDTRRSKDISYRASELIARRFRENLKIGDIARELQVSVRSLQRAISAYHLNFRTYLQMVRMEAARFLLMSSDRPLKDIAQEVGLSKYTHFSESFKRMFGLSPVRYRQLRGTGSRK